MDEFEEQSEELRIQFAEAFERTTDPLKAYETTFESLDADPFELFVTEALLADDISERTVDQYRIAYRQWHDYMDGIGRHPACPNDAHVRGFAHWLQAEQNNGAIQTIKQKLHKLNRAYRFWQREPALPHTQHYDPFALGREKIRWDSFDDTRNKSPPPIPRETLQEILASIPDLREQTPIATQLKLGLRVGELRNIQLQDVNLHCPELNNRYPSLGTHERVRDRTNAIYVPANNERKGNKSAVGRLLPLDTEMQWAFRRFLQVRPTCVDTWFFISKEFSRIDLHAVNDSWKAAFHPEYAESSNYRAVTSHFGRHYFTSYWRKDQNLPRELVQYMRGDRVGDPGNDTSGLFHYLHAYYEDIEERYRRDIYDLGLRDYQD